MAIDRIEALEGFSLVDSTKGIVKCNTCHTNIHHSKQRVHIKAHLHSKSDHHIETGHTMGEVLGISGVAQESHGDSDPFDVEMDDILR